MSGGTSSGRPNMVCGGRNVDPRPEGFRGEKQEVKSSEEQIINIRELFSHSIKYNGEASDFARSFTKRVD